MFWEFHALYISITNGVCIWWQFWLVHDFNAAFLQDFVIFSQSAFYNSKVVLIVDHFYEMNYDVFLNNYLCRGKDIFNFHIPVSVLFEYLQTKYELTAFSVKDDFEVSITVKKSKRSISCCLFAMNHNLFSWTKIVSISVRRSGVHRTSDA